MRSGTGPAVRSGTRSGTGPAVRSGMRSGTRCATGSGARFAVALLCIGLLGTLNGIATAGPSFGRSRQLPCVFETTKLIPLSKEAELVRLNARLVLSSAPPTDGQRSQPENLPSDNIPSFIVQESSVDILQYANEDIDMLDCRISPYFAAETESIWPGVEVRVSSSDSWFTCTIKHTAGKYTATALLVQEQKEKEIPNPRELFPGIAQQVHVSALLLVRTAPARLPAALGSDVLLGCAFALGRRADPTVQWLMHQQGPHRKLLFAYRGSGKRVERVARRAEMVLEEIPKGNASLLLRDTAVRDEGTYSCSVSAAFLTAEQTIQLHVEEKPTVTLNVNSLSLVEGEQHKLVCDIRHYYPHNIQAQWLREPKDSRKVPDIMKNVVSSSIRQSSNGTYSSSRYFFLTASLKDDGHKYTCWVDHPSLQTPIRRSVTVEVKEAASVAWVLLLLSLTVGLLGAFWYHQKVRCTAKPKPY